MSAVFTPKSGTFGKVICAFVFLLGNVSCDDSSQRHSRQFSFKWKDLIGMRSKEFALDANIFYYLSVSFQALKSPQIHMWREGIAWTF